MKINEKMFELMRDTTRLLKTGGPGAATRSIQRALGIGQDHGVPTGRARPAAAPVSQPMRDINPAPKARIAGAESAAGFVPELLAGLRIPSLFDQMELPIFTPEPESDTQQDVYGDGQFVAGSFANAAGTRSHKLYFPRGYHGQTLPLVVMLHGCTQNPDDFAAGTRMNVLADEKQFLVVYPAQAQSANGSKCWNWFQAMDQERDQGEPSIIAGITREIIANHPVDPLQVYVAGLSAGGAMAIILGTAYPELYAAVGVHSGLPYAAAKDLPSALAAMHGRSQPEHPRPGRGSGKPSRLQAIPVIVFHGDRDKTVHPQNGDQIVMQSIPKPAAGAARSGNGARIRPSVVEGQVPGGHGYTRTIHHDENGQEVAEQWLVHGAGHAWSGGSRSGSYTDSKGPDASQEMMRFFSTHPRPKQGANS